MDSNAPQTVTLTAPDISCMHCVRAIEERLGGIDGVNTIQAKADDKSVHVTFDPSVVSLTTIKNELADEGYPVQE